MEKRRSGGPPRPRLSLGKESLRRLGSDELARVHGGDLVEPDALVGDRRSMDLCPAPFEAGLALSSRAGD